MDQFYYKLWMFIVVVVGLAAGLTIAFYEPKLPKYADRIQTGYVACTSAYYLDQYEQAPHRRQVGMMMADDCLPTERITDYPFMVMEPGEVSRVRLLLPDDAYADVYLFDDAIAAVRK